MIQVTKTDKVWYGHELDGVGFAELTDIMELVQSGKPVLLADSQRDAEQVLSVKVKMVDPE